MKTYFADIIPKIQRYSQKLDNLTLLTDQHQVLIDEIEQTRTIYIFRPSGDLLVSKNGEVEKVKWEYLGNKSLLIDTQEGCYLFKHSFFDPNIIALKIDSKEEYALFVNENRYNGEINSFDKLIDFLQQQYLYSLQQKQIEDTMGVKIGKETKKTVKIKSAAELEREKKMKCFFGLYSFFQ
jgi:hypothetical protein